MRTRNAKVIIPLAVGVWLISMILWKTDMPLAAQRAIGAGLVIAMAVGIPVVVFYLMAEQGWSGLAKRYRSRVPHRGGWRPLPTAQMAMVSVHDPEFRRARLRFISTLRVATSEEALHLSVLLSKVPLLGPRFFPDVHIPWEAVTNATTFEAPGWFWGNRETGALLQANYDPNDTGTFIQLEVGEPTVFIQLPEVILGGVLSRLPMGRA